eukprot:CAMPEP_0201620118 /NCGR_PEP_ID=MMETSP0492-20130828/43323_1 /ASSEMBLY_ACC=CAM_ASM_000837 /TAXON_ID=420259 /ORGANISM="Thalassiosira gravida, Strain GMp14c1" /LENGTH=55 /DNA_ID=CAMNT_0048089211 /DNA_START=34 /DNA_END=196 /DNA_ORIENTATION=-
MTVIGKERYSPLHPSPAMVVAVAVDDAVVDVAPSPALPPHDARERMAQIIVMTQL